MSSGFKRFLARWVGITDEWGVFHAPQFKRTTFVLQVLQMLISAATVVSWVVLTYQRPSDSDGAIFVVRYFFGVFFVFNYVFMAAQYG